MNARDPLGMTPAVWEALAADSGLPGYRGRQFFDAIHRRRVLAYSAMTELPGALRERLTRELPIRLPEIVRHEGARDGSVKFGLRFPDGALAEAVYMPGDAGKAVVNEFADARAAAPTRSSQPATSGRSPGIRQRRPKADGKRATRSSTLPAERFTICLSSQTGCAVDCAFCVTGRLGAGRNLEAGEIMGQLYAVLRETGEGTEGMRLVFMGMGEPFLNPEGLLPALEIVFETISPHRVTVSTSGITPAFEKFAALPRRPNLAVSLNAADEAVRARLMPITRTYPLAGLLRAMKAWPLEPRRHILVEYVLIAGVNDRDEDAKRLARLLRGLRVKVNVIPLNEDPVYLPGWKRPEETAIDRFVKALADARLTVTVRRSRGPDASAACGQLKGRTEDVRKRLPQTGR